MDMNITEISQDKLEQIIKNDKRVIEYHDLHIHKPSSKYSFISFHIVLDDETISLKEIKLITNEIKHNLKINSFNHILIQVDSKEDIKNRTNCYI